MTHLDPLRGIGKILREKNRHFTSVIMDDNEFPTFPLGYLLHGTGYGSYVVHESLPGGGAWRKRYFRGRPTRTSRGSLDLRVHTRDRGRRNIQETGFDTSG